MATRLAAVRWCERLHWRLLRYWGIPFNAHDQSYLVPFGIRAEWQPASRVRLSVGGGACFRDTSEPNVSGSQNPWGWQLKVSARSGLTHSGQFWIGATARYYYGRFDPYKKQ